MNLKLNLNGAIWLSQLIDSHAGLPKVHPSGRPVMPWQGPDEDEPPADPLELRALLDDLITDYYEAHPKEDEEEVVGNRPYMVRVGGSSWTTGPEIDDVSSIREGRDFIESYGNTADWGTVTDEDTGRTVVFRRDPNGDGTRWYRAETRPGDKKGDSNE